MAIKTLSASMKEWVQHGPNELDDAEIEQIMFKAVEELWERGYHVRMEYSGEVFENP